MDKDVKKDVKTHVKPYANYILKNRAKVLNLLSQPISFSKITSKLNYGSSSTLYRMFKRLIKDGLITKERTLTDNGFSIVKNYLVQSNDVIIKPNTIRINDLMFSVRILHKPKNYDYRKNNVISMKVRDYKIIDLKNNYQEQFIINDILIRATTENILVIFPDIYTETEAEGIKRAVRILMDIIPKIENLHKITLIKENYCNIRVSKQHYALIYNQLAKLYRTDYKDNTFKVIDEIDGKTRLIIDFSLGIPEFEATHYIKSPEDINKCQKFFKNMINKEHYLPSEAKEMLEVNQAMLYEVGQGLIQNQNQLNQIIRLIKPQRPRSIIPKEKPDYFG